MNNHYPSFPDNTFQAEPFGPYHHASILRAGKLSADYCGLRIRWNTFNQDQQAEALEAMRAIEQEAQELLPMVIGSNAMTLQQVVKHPFDPAKPSAC